MPMLSDKSSPRNASASLPLYGDLAHCSHSAKPMGTCMSSVALTSSETEMSTRSFCFLACVLLRQAPRVPWLDYPGLF
jgi:hypothetical protein